MQFDTELRMDLGDTIHHTGNSFHPSLPESPLFLQSNIDVFFWYGNQILDFKDKHA